MSNISSRLLSKLVLPALAATLLFSSGCSYVVSYYGLKDIPLPELKAEYANSESEFIPVNNMMVHIRDEGSGPVLVMLHGVLSSLHTWEDWVPLLSRNYRIIRMDLPGFGLTGTPDGISSEFDLEMVKDTVLKVLEERDITKATFIGNSFGGYISWRLAVDQPELVERLVLIDARSFPQEWPWLLKLLTNWPTRQLAPITTPRYTVSIGLYDVYGDDDRIAKGTVRRYHRLLLREGNRDAMLAILDWLKETEQPFGTEPEAGIYDIKQPLMTMWGKKDKWIPFDPIGKLWHKAYPEATHVVYEDAGHIPMEEIPAQTLLDLTAFLKATDAELGY